MNKTIKKNKIEIVKEKAGILLLSSMILQVNS